MQEKRRLFQKALGRRADSHKLLGALLPQYILVFSCSWDFEAPAADTQRHESPSLGAALARLLPLLRDRQLHLVRLVQWEVPSSERHF